MVKLDYYIYHKNMYILYMTTSYLLDNRLCEHGKDSICFGQHKTKSKKLSSSLFMFVYLKL